MVVLAAGVTPVTLFETIYHGSGNVSPHVSNPGFSSKFVCAFVKATVAKNNETNKVVLFMSVLFLK
jgi:hypothetical protein